MAAEQNNTWFDSLAGYALQGAEIYARISEAKAASQPNNATTYRPEDRGGAQPSGTASTTAETGKKLPAWVLPVSIAGGALVLLLAVLGLRRS